MLCLRSSLKSDWLSPSCLQVVFWCSIQRPKYSLCSKGSKWYIHYRKFSQKWEPTVLRVMYYNGRKGQNRKPLSLFIYYKQFPNYMGNISILGKWNSPWVYSSGPCCVKVMSKAAFCKNTPRCSPLGSSLHNQWLLF